MPNDRKNHNETGSIHPPLPRDLPPTWEAIGPLPSTVPGHSLRASPSITGNSEDDVLLLDRAKRIASGDVRQDDYLIVTDEIENEIKVVTAGLVNETGSTVVSYEAVEKLRQDLTLQLYCGGSETMCQRRERGVIVLALGAANVEKLRQRLPVKDRQGCVIEYPHPRKRG